MLMSVVVDDANSAETKPQVLQADNKSKMREKLQSFQHKRVA
jgi:hypothetical protein